MAITIFSGPSISPAEIHKNIYGYNACVFSHIGQLSQEIISGLDYILMSPIKSGELHFLINEYYDISFLKAQPSLNFA